MRHTLVAIFATILAINTLYAQSATERIAAAINGNDILYLEHNLQRCKDSLPDHIYLMAEALRCSHTNRYHRSNKAIEELLNNHNQTIGEEAVGNFYGMLISNLHRSGDYSSAARLLEGSVENRESYNYFAALSRQRPLEVEKPRGDVVVPFTISKLGSGRHIHIPVEIGNRTESFIFDTGANKYNVVTESCAKRYKFRPIFDSLPTAGVGGDGLSRVVTIPKIKIGKIRLKNPLFIVIPDNSTPVDSLSGFRLEFVLGTDVMEALGEIQFDMEAKTMTIPASESEKTADATPLTHADSYYIHPAVNGTMLKMQFDTGAVDSSMHYRYLSEFGDSVTFVGEERVSHAHGFGGTATYNVRTAERIEFTIGDKSRVARNIEITSSDHALPYQQDEYAYIGANIVRSFKHFTINFRQMFVTAE